MSIEIKISFSTMLSDVHDFRSQFLDIFPWYYVTLGEAKNLIPSSPCAFVQFLAIPINF